MSALDVVLPHLACPVCGGPLSREQRTVRCPAGHAFDLARHGYLPLLRGGARPGQGDTAEMVAAREAFLGRGHYAPISAAVAETVAEAVAETVATTVTDRPRPLLADLAGGTGHHLAAVLDHVPHAVGVDLELSPPALRRAARAHSRLAAVRADIWQPLPLRDRSCDAVLSIFGPRNAAEIIRVLTPGRGRLVVVTPEQEHLGELVGALGMLTVAPDKGERLARQLAGFAVVQEQPVRYQVAMTRDDVRNEVLMGPSAHHVDPAELDRSLDAFPQATDVTVAVTVATYRVA